MEIRFDASNTWFVENGVCIDMPKFVEKSLLNNDLNIWFICDSQVNFKMPKSQIRLTYGMAELLMEWSLRICVNACLRPNEMKLRLSLLSWRSLCSHQLKIVLMSLDISFIPFCISLCKSSVTLELAKSFRSPTSNWRIYMRVDECRQIIYKSGENRRGDNIALWGADETGWRDTHSDIVLACSKSSTSFVWIIFEEFWI